jgi:hypothetical protein
MISGDDGKPDDEFVEVNSDVAPSLALLFHGFRGRSPLVRKAQDRFLGLQSFQNRSSYRERTMPGGRL